MEADASYPVVTCVTSIIGFHKPPKTQPRHRAEHPGDAVDDLREPGTIVCRRSSEAQIAVRSWISYRSGDRLPMPGRAWFSE